MKKVWFLISFYLGFLLPVNAQPLIPEHGGDHSRNIRLPNKIIPLDNPVYRILDYYEAAGKIRFLNQAKPYSKIFILNALQQLTEDNNMPPKEKKVIDRTIADLSRESNGLQISEYAAENSCAVLGFGAETTIRDGMGDNSTWSANLIPLPYLSGDLGKHLSFSASIGTAIEKLAPDLFYGSYTKGGKVNFPYLTNGFAYLPYQFNYETLYLHKLISGDFPNESNISKKMAVGLIYYTELNTNWLNGILQISLNNHRRSWGHDDQNLLLSATARRFPGLELKMEPAPWFRYSFLTGSLFDGANQSPGYKKGIYGYDTGELQNMVTLHLLEITPTRWLQISAFSGNIWSKRFDLTYLMPFSLSIFSELEVGDYDNLSNGFDIAVRIPAFGKTWMSIYNDEFSLDGSGPKLRMPRNRYAWQIGLKTPLLSHIIPGTTSVLKYTRLTPFVYTHYPETRFNEFSSRPLDMTYTHDGFNLGFYLPPNSGEVSLSLVNIAIPDLVLSSDTRYIIHGTNDLSGSNIYQIYGDVYRYQIEGTSGGVNDYPLMDFTKDGIYDHTILSEFRFDWKIRKVSILNYFRLTGTLGIAHTWWESNQSGVAAPPSRMFYNASLGVIVDI